MTFKVGDVLVPEIHNGKSFWGFKFAIVKGISTNSKNNNHQDLLLERYYERINEEGKIELVASKILPIIPHRMKLKKERTLEEWL